MQAVRRCRELPVIRSARTPVPADGSGCAAPHALGLERQVDGRPDQSGSRIAPQSFDGWTIGVAGSPDRRSRPHPSLSVSSRYSPARWRAGPPPPGGTPPATLTTRRRLIGGWRATPATVDRGLWRGAQVQAQPLEIRLAVIREQKPESRTAAAACPCHHTHRQSAATWQGSCSRPRRDPTDQGHHLPGLEQQEVQRLVRRVSGLDERRDLLRMFTGQRHPFRLAGAARVPARPLTQLAFGGEQVIPQKSTPPPSAA